MGQARQLNKLLEKMPEEDLIAPLHRTRHIGLARLDNHIWATLSDEEKKERVEQMKKKHRSALEFFEAKDARRTVHVEHELTTELEHMNPKLTTTMETERYACKCGSHLFFVELVEEEHVEKRDKRYTKIIYRFTCMNTSCKRVRQIEDREDVQEISKSERWIRLQRSMHAQITITYGEKTVAIPRV